MESNNELKQIDIKNRTCYYFDDIMKVQDMNFIDILCNEKSNNSRRLMQSFYGWKAIVY